MVTRDRLALAKRSIRCFLDQTYPRLELIVVSQGSAGYSRALGAHLEACGIARARLVTAPPEKSLGGLRNLSCDAAGGDIICQWDDDDCYHPERVAHQAAPLLRGEARACYLTDHLHLFEAERTLYWLDWTRDGRSDTERLVFPPSVVMCKDDRFRYPEIGRSAQLGEDLALAAQLFQQVPVVAMSGSGWLYLYRFHGANTCGQDHHHSITVRRSLHAESIHRRADDLRRALRYYRVPGPLVVCAREGPVFSVE